MKANAVDPWTDIKQKDIKDNDGPYFILLPLRLNKGNAFVYLDGMHRYHSNCIFFF